MSKSLLGLFILLGVVVAFIQVSLVVMAAMTHNSTALLLVLLPTIFVVWAGSQVLIDYYWANRTKTPTSPYKRSLGGDEQ